MAKNNILNSKIMIVDDEKGMLETLCVILRKNGYSVVTALSAEQALSICDNEKFNLIVTDAKMKGIDGFEFMNMVKKDFPDTAFIMITAYATPKLAVKAIKDGAFEYISKPFDPEEFLIIVKRGLEHNRLILENKRLVGELSNETGLRGVVGNSGRMREICKLIYVVAPTSSPVLIEGEDGTGKELMARALHFHSARGGNPFFSVNCAGVSDKDLEIELFGYEKGAVSAPLGSKKSCFEVAQSGTLYINEVGDIPAGLQKKLLNVLKYQKCVRNGGSKEIKVDVRVVAATTRDLEKEVEKGRCSEGLFYRLNVINIKIPPLRERQEDMPLLMDYFLKKYAVLTGKIINGFEPPVKEVFVKYSWPGNVSELENVVEKAVVLEKSNKIGLQSIPEGIIKPGKRRVKEEAPAELPESGIDYQEEVSNYEEGLIKLAIKRSEGNVAKAAKILKLSRHALRYQMQKLGMLLKK